MHQRIEKCNRPEDDTFCNIMSEKEGFTGFLSYSKVSMRECAVEDNVYSYPAQHPELTTC
jgi:hypothetical protein